MAIRFDASGDYLLRTTALPTVGSFTYLCWVRRMVASATWSYLLTLENNTATASAGAYMGWDTSNSFHIFTDSTHGHFATQPAVGTTFVCAMVGSAIGANGLTGYWRYPSSSTWNTISLTSATFTSGAIYVANDSWGESSDVRVENLKVWDRALTTAELLAESRSRRVLFPTGLHLHWPLAHAGDTFDRSGRGKHATRAGTLATEPILEIPQRKPINHRVVFNPSGGSDVSIALSGQVFTASAGALGVTHSQALTGSLISSASGTVIGTGSIALAGTAVTLSAGTIAVSHSNVLSGDLATFATGTITTANAVPVSGTAMTSSAGTLVPGISCSLAGQAITASSGSLLAAIQIALSGSSATFSQGTITASAGSDVSVALTGQAVILSAGALGVSREVPLVGSSVTVSTGSLIAAISAGLTGGSVTFAAGTLIPGSTIPLSGGSVTFSTGTVTAVGGSASATITIKAGSWLRYRIIE